MTLYDMVKTLASAVKSDSAVTAWCQAQFSKNPLVRIRIDARNMPGRESCPLSLLIPAFTRYLYARKL